jgi:Ca-activated chloride channel family protein
MLVVNLREKEEFFMNTRPLAPFLFFTLIISACSAQAPTPIAQAPRAENQYNQPAPAIPQYPAAPQPQPTTYVGENYYQDYGVNPRTDTRYDHLSTFALDVDTASYAVARRYVRDGSLPPIEAVRAEEFVNAFDQGYAAPTSAAFTIYADGAPNPFSRDGTYFLRFGVQGYRPTEAERKPLRLTFVIDTSGSMKEQNRLELLKDSLHLLVDRLNWQDSVAIVAYNTDARVILDPTPGDHRSLILAAIDRLVPGGTTNAEAGLRLGYSYAMRAYQAEASNRVILCSDGVANTGETRPESLLDMVGGYVAEGIDLTAVGVGMGNFNDVLLEQLADRGNGNYAYIDTLEEAQRLFVDKLTATLEVIAYDAKAQVDFNPDTVREYRLVGYENRALADQAFRDDSADAGEIGAGHTVTALYQVKLAPGAEGRIATVQLRWQDADTRQVREINGNFNTWNLYPSFDESDPHYQLSVAVAAYAEILRASPYITGSWSEIVRLANQAARLLPADETVQEFAELVRLAARIAR